MDYSTRFPINNRVSQDSLDEDRIPFPSKPEQKKEGTTSKTKELSKHLYTDDDRIPFPPFQGEKFPTKKLIHPSRISDTDSKTFSQIFQLQQTFTSPYPIINEIIQQIRTLNFYQFFKFADKLRNLQYQQFSHNPETKTINTILQSLTNFDPHKMEEQIMACMGAIRDTEASNVQGCIADAVYKVAKLHHEKIDDWKQCALIACALDAVKYTEPQNNRNDIIFHEMVSNLQLNFIKKNLNIESLVGLIFSFRKVEFQKYHLNSVTHWYDFFCEIMHDQLHKLKAQELALIAKAFGTKGYYNYPASNFFSLLCQAFESRINDFSTNEASYIIWYLSRLSEKNKNKNIIMFDNKTLINSLKDRIYNHLDRLNTCETVRVSWSLITLNFLDKIFFQKVDAKIQNEIHLLNNDELITITKMISKGLIEEGQTLLNLMNLIEQRIKNPTFFDIEKLSQVVRSVLIKFCLGDRDPNFNKYTTFIKKILKLLFDALSSLSSIELLKFDIALARIKTVYEIFTGFEKFHQQHLISNSRIEEIFNLETNRNNTKTSMFHRNVSDHLNELLLEYENRPTLLMEQPFGEFSIDIVLEFTKDHYIYIEVDGECHNDEFGNPLPKDRVKETLIELKGIDLVRITQNEWPGYGQYETTFYDTERRQLLLNKLNEKVFSQLTLKPKQIPH